MALKSKRGRPRVVITRELIAHKLLAARSGDEDFVFTARTGAPRNHRTVGRAFTQAVTAAKADEAATFHWLRHTHSSQLVAPGWDVAAVAARLGDSVATVQSTYLHEFDAVRREETQRDALTALAADGSAMAARAGTARALRTVPEAANSPM